jgi:hypothetical protein
MACAVYVKLDSPLYYYLFTSSDLCMQASNLCVSLSMLLSTNAGSLCPSCHLCLPLCSTGGGWFHPIHMHLVDFYVLQVRGAVESGRG